MPIPKKIFFATMLFGLSAALGPNVAMAQKFNSLISNPFVFCSLPRPCKLCQPFRRIYKEICSDQNKGNYKEDTSIRPFYGSHEEIREEVVRLTSVLAEQVASQEAARIAIGRCLQMNGQVHVELCAAQMDDFEDAQSSVRAYQDEIDRLEALLLEPDCKRYGGARGCGNGYDEYER